MQVPGLDQLTPGNLLGDFQNWIGSLFSGPSSERLINLMELITSAPKPLFSSDWFVNRYVTGLAIGLLLALIGLSIQLLLILFSDRYQFSGFDLTHVIETLFVGSAFVPALTFIQVHAAKLSVGWRIDAEESLRLAEAMGENQENDFILGLATSALTYLLIVILMMLLGSLSLFGHVAGLPVGGVYGLRRVWGLAQSMLRMLLTICLTSVTAAPAAVGILNITTDLVLGQDSSIWRVITGLAGLTLTILVPLLLIYVSYQAAVYVTGGKVKADSESRATRVGRKTKDLAKAAGITAGVIFAANALDKRDTTSTKSNANSIVKAGLKKGGEKVLAKHPVATVSTVAARVLLKGGSKTERGEQ